MQRKRSKVSSNIFASAVGVVCGLTICSFYGEHCYNVETSSDVLKQAHQQTTNIMHNNKTILPEIKMISRPIDAFSESSKEDGYCKHETDVCPSIFLSLDQIWTQLNRTNSLKMSNFVLNIGANDGVLADPIFPLFEKHPNLIGGLLFEPSNKLFNRLKSNYVPYPFAQPVNSGITPSNGVSLGKQYGDNLSTYINEKSNMREFIPYPTEEKSMDIYKVDTDGCDCHILEEMLKDPFYRAKVIQVETNHHIPPPIAYQDMCKNDVYGRGSNSKDIWGCSVQAAYDIVKKYGYELLQYDWPDAVFIHSDYRNTFLPLLGENPGGAFIRNYYIGYHWAKEHYTRFTNHQENRDLVKSLIEMSLRAYMDPKGVLNKFTDICKPLWTKRPLWTKLWIAGTEFGIEAQTSEGSDQINITSFNTE